MAISSAGSMTGSRVSIQRPPPTVRPGFAKPCSSHSGMFTAWSDKVLAMGLSELLLAGDAKRLLWVEAGTAMIAVDTLVHNFLHRTGILELFGANHPYGPRCYEPGNCAAIIEHISSRIDARQFNPAFPANFPRF